MLGGTEGVIFGGAVGSTVINGDAGSHPFISYVSGNPMIILNGVDYGNGSVSKAAVDDVDEMLVVAFEKSPFSPITTSLGGSTITPGVYRTDSGILIDSCYQDQCQCPLDWECTSLQHLLGGWKLGDNWHCL